MARGKAVGRQEHQARPGRLHQSSHQLAVAPDRLGPQRKHLSFMQHHLDATGEAWVKLRHVCPETIGPH